MLYLLLMCLFWALPHNYVAAQFGPVWHQPNQYDIDGSSCASKRPTVERVCPLYGVKAIGLSQMQVEALCAANGFACDGHLFVDGSCRHCPEEFNVVEDSGTVFCRHSHNGTELYRDLVNPFDCLGSGEIARIQKGAYRPCYHTDVAPIIRVPQYYKGSDLVGELTMQSCFNDTGLPAVEVFIPQLSKSVPFPLIHEINHTETEAGYLQCPQYSATYDYAAPGWIFLYCFFGFGFFLQFLFYLYKQLVDKDISKHSKATFLVSEAASSLPREMKEDTKGHFTQIGLKDDIFGTCCFVYLVLMTLGTQLFMLVQVLDAYGLTLTTFCAGNEAVQAACKASFESGADPSWRAGYTCAVGCLFPFTLVDGTHETWPYSSKSGDGTHAYAIWIGTWHVTILWFILIKFAQPKLRSWFRVKAPLGSADIILCSKPIEASIRIDGEEDSKIIRLLNRWDTFLARFIGQKMHTKSCRVIYFAETNVRCFDFQASRFTFNKEQERFVLDTITVAKTNHDACVQGRTGLTSAAVGERQKYVGRNMIHVEVPSWTKLTFDEFFDYFYFYQFFCLWIWFSFIYWTMALSMVLMVIAAGFIKIVTRRSSLQYIQQLAGNYIPVTVLRDGTFQTVLSDALVPGDVMVLETHMVLPADAVLTHGRCIMDESSLTGELTPVPKIPLPDDLQSFQRDFDHQRYTLLAGTSVASVTKQDGNVVAVVLATGVSTDKGAIIRDILYPPPLSFKFDDHWRVAFPLIIGWGVCTGLVCVYFYRTSMASWYYGAIIMSQVMSPLVPAMFVAGVSQGVYRLKKIKLYCSVPHRLLLAGKIKIFCFDKTGTLTKPGLSFRGVCPVDELNMIAPPQTNLQNLQTILGTCHEIDWDSSNKELKPVGNKLDVEMYENSGCHVISNGLLPVIECEGQTYRILRRMEFDRKSMSMSVVIENTSTQQRLVYCKGSCEAVFSMLKEGSQPLNAESQVVHLALDGFYTIALASKEYTGPQDVAAATRQELEDGLTLQGLMVFQNQVKEDAADLIDEIKGGSIRPVMITGDFALAALKVAREVHLSTANNVFIADVKGSGSVITWSDYDSGSAIKDPLKYEEALENGDIDLAITSKAFTILCNMERADGSTEMKRLLPYSRIFARMRPEQKVKIVELYMEMGITAMCGDGANDAGALRTCHCGVAIAESNADISIVAPFSCASKRLSAVTQVIKEGRCILSKAVAGYKALIIYGEILAFCSLVTFYFGAVASEAFWITWDSLVTAGMVWCLLQSKASDRLAPYRPTSKLLGLETVLSVMLQVLFNWFWVVVAIVYLFQQDWFHCHEFDANLIDQGKWFLKGSNYEAGVVSLVASFQFASAAPVNNIGFDYRQSWWKNYYLVVYYAIWLAFYSSLVLSGPYFFTCLFLINCGDKSLVQHWVDHQLLPPNTPFPITMPEGCPCDQQVIPDHPRCEAEYIDCSAYSYNQVFHHNIIETHSRYWLFGFIVANIVCLFVGEGLIMVGPVRRWLRKRRAMQKQNTAKRLRSVIVGRMSRTDVSLVVQPSP